MWLWLTKPKLSIRSHPGVVLGTLLAFCFPGCQSTVPAFLTPLAKEMRKNGRELLFSFLHSFCSVCFSWQLVLTQPLLSFLSSVSAERRRKKDGLARCTCSFDPHVVHEQWRRTSDKRCQEWQPIWSGWTGRGAAAFDFGAIFWSRLHVGPHLPQGPVLTENHVCVCVCVCVCRVLMLNRCKEATCSPLT